MQLIIKNGLILQSNGTFLKGQVGIDQDKIAAIYFGENPPLHVSTPQIDAEGFLVCPGLIDSHIHGGNTFSFALEEAGWEKAWGKMEEWLSPCGITSILATGTSLPLEGTLNFLDRASALAKKNDTSQVEILGAYMEGPYINKNKKGAHLEEYIRPADKNEAAQILERAGGLIKVWALAPEIEENLSLLKTLSAAGISVSIAHSEAGYEAAMTAFSAGANRLTHTFNAIPAIDHRYKGIITAAWQHGVFMELISDGHHVSPTIIKMFIAASDTNKILLISDNNEFSGLPDGSYIRGKRKLILTGGQLKTESGSLAGSVTGLNKCALNLTRWGFPAGTALKMVTENPARSIGVFDRKGSITLGKDADIAILDGQFDAAMTIKGGRIVYRSDRFPLTVSGS